MATNRVFGFVPEVFFRRVGKPKSMADCGKGASKGYKERGRFDFGTLSFGSLSLGEQRK
jgi:hypothetical protein